VIWLTTSTNFPIPLPQESIAFRGPDRLSRDPYKGSTDELLGRGSPDSSSHAWFRFLEAMFALLHSGMQITTPDPSVRVPRTLAPGLASACCSDGKTARFGTPRCWLGGRATLLQALGHASRRRVRVRGRADRGTQRRGRRRSLLADPGTSPRG